MARRSSIKSQAGLIDLVKSAGWKEDSKTGGDKHIRWFHPRDPDTYYSLRDAAELARLKRTNGVRKIELQKGAGA